MLVTINVCPRNESDLGHTSMVSKVKMFPKKLLTVCPKTPRRKRKKK